MTLHSSTVVALVAVGLVSACADDNGGEMPTNSAVTTTPTTADPSAMSTPTTPDATTPVPPPTPSETVTAPPTMTVTAEPSGTAGAAPTGTAGAGGMGGSTAAGSAGAGAGGATGGAAGGAGEGGSGGMEEDLPPENLSETGLFVERGTGPELVLAEGVREFQPTYWLWSDGSDKRRYFYLPPGTQIDTSDPDHWIVPVGTKLWKSFIIGGQLVETRLIERTGEGDNDFRYATYFWQTAEDTDAIRMNYKNLLLNAAGTTHDIPNGLMCEKCHGASRERALGFSALQLNHDLGGVNLATLMDEGLLTDPISLDIKMPGDDQLTQDALGYLHANCGNCHNDTDGLPEESVPAPQMLLRISVNDLTLEDTDIFATAIGQATTASDELGIDYRILPGDIMQSAVYFRMTQRMIEDQMPPIGTEMTDADGLALIQAFIESLSQTEADAGP